MLEHNQIYLGDCLELMKDIPDKSIDMILADLPYGTTACAWDSIIPLEPLWKHYKRIIKDRGAVVLMGSQPFTTILINAGGLNWFKYEWVWDKGVGLGHQAKIKPIRIHESVLVFCKGKTIYNPRFIKKVHKRPHPKTSGTTLMKLKAKRDLLHLDSMMKYPTSVLNISGRSAEINPLNRVHSTQKPVALFSYLIRTYTNSGDLVLDNVAGSGTTAIAAIETGRDWLLIEKDADYYQIAKDRIETRLKQPFLFEVEVKQPQPIQTTLIME